MSRLELWERMMRDVTSNHSPQLWCCVFRWECVYSRPGFGEAHGQQHVQSGPMFDGAQSGLALPPRGHFGVQVLFSCHNSLLHRYVSPAVSALVGCLQLSDQFLTPGAKLGQKRRTSQFTRVKRKRVLKSETFRSIPLVRMKAPKRIELHTWSQTHQLRGQP